MIENCWLTNCVCEAGGPIAKVFFPSSGLISLVIPMSNGHMVEASTTGRDGIVGAGAALGDVPACHTAIVQMGCVAATIDVVRLRQVANDREAIWRFLLNHEQVLLAQAQRLAACNATHPLVSRLCRWLLRAADCSGQLTIRIKQEQLAELLGVKRTSMSSIAQRLEHAGVLKTHRGHVELVDVKALQHQACECCEAISTDYDRLLVGGALGLAEAV